MINNIICEVHMYIVNVFTNFLQSTQKSLYCQTHDGWLHELNGTAGVTRQLALRDGFRHQLCDVSTNLFNVVLAELEQRFYGNAMPCEE